MARGRGTSRAGTATLRAPSGPASVCRALDLERITTHKGVELELGYAWDVDDGIAEGWTVHRLGVQARGREAGYLKISYVPADRAARLFPDPFHYALERSGSFYALKRLLERAPEAEWDEPELRAAVESGRGWVPWDEQQRLKGLGACGLRDEWAAVRSRIQEDFAEQHRSFLEFHVDKPLVDYIRVFDGYDCDGEDDFRRQGIALSLYAVGARWMAANGMCLWASGLQSEEAAEAWERLGQTLPIGVAPSTNMAGESRTRRFLDGALLDPIEAQAP
ncbi:hypothetical protein [Miltoncostaea oceani]|uniref:hypothetical protein n=1 Tax=Miltoncostaea oceani TaxID=2843216 RepID=UPI001C3D2D3D|nr:hypothetical protein [Miltoncostaea oceani]